jgi:hypothetical protein
METASCFRPESPNMIFTIPIGSVPGFMLVPIRSSCHIHVTAVGTTQTGGHGRTDAERKAQGNVTDFLYL